MPVSGTVKSTFPTIRDSLSFRGDLELGAALIIGLVVLTAVWLAGNCAASVPRESRICSPVLILVLACVFHYIHAFLFLDWGVYWWHFAVYGLAIAVVLAGATERITASRPRWRKLAIRVLVAILLTLAAITKAEEFIIKFQQHRAWLAAAEWAQEHTPPESIIAIRDAGLFGYYSDRRTVNLDGKANGYEYAQYLKRDEICAYLQKVNVNYLADIHARYHEGIYQIHIRRPNQVNVSLDVAESDEVFRKDVPPVRHGLRKSPAACFAIWQYAGMLDSEK
jgi:hypothetical protein